jgi:hypothetical protein
MTITHDELNLLIETTVYATAFSFLCVWGIATVISSVLAYYLERKNNKNNEVTK